MIEQAFVKTLLDYCKDTGLFRWKVSRPPRGVKGAIAGFDTGHGYIKISIHGKKYYAHRLAFLWVDGYMPKEVDHVNHCRHDNRWSNLRPSDRAHNTANVIGRSGVRMKYGRWYARYSHTHLGVFDTEAEALTARKAAQIMAAGVDPDETHDLAYDNIHSMTDWDSTDRRR